MYLYSKIIEISKANIWEKILVWYQNSLIKELFDSFGERIFHVDFQVYENISLGAGAGATAKNLILGLMLGTIIAACVMAYTRRVHGRFVRALLRREALSPETAITLRETGLFRNPSVRRALLGGALSKLTRCVETEEFVAARAEQADQTEADPNQAPAARGLVEVDGFTPDLLTARFYIPEDLKYRAEFRYEQRGSGTWQLILTIVLAIAISVLLCQVLPALFGLADRLVNVFS